MKKSIAGALLIGALFITGSAIAADTYNFRTRQGPVTVTVHRDGRVEGYYPWNGGQMVGRAERNGTLTGIWTQSKSDQACREQRNGTFFWGRFYITDPYQRPVRGFYSYCGRNPDIDWGFRGERG